MINVALDATNHRLHSLPMFAVHLNCMNSNSHLAHRCINLIDEGPGEIYAFQRTSHLNHTFTNDGHRNLFNRIL